MTIDANSQLALLSTRVYARRDVNRGPMPLDWQELSWLPDSFTGFSAGVYRSSSDPSRIVIAFTGTNDHTIADPVSANMPAAIGLPSPQAAQAIAPVRQAARRRDAAASQGAIR
jgi:hypothetical protein